MLLKVLSKYKPDANLESAIKIDNITRSYEGRTILHWLAEEYSEVEFKDEFRDKKKKIKAEKNKIQDTMTLLVLLFNADLTLTDKRSKKPLDYLDDLKLKKYLEEDIIKLRDNISKTYGTDANDFILHHFEQNPNKSIENCMKDFFKNLKPLMDEYARNTGSPSTSLNTAKVEESGKNCTIM